MNSESTRIQSQCKKSILCLYTNNEKFKKKIKKTIPRIVVSKTIKKEYSKKKDNPEDVELEINRELC